MVTVAAADDLDAVAATAPPQAFLDTGPFATMAAAALAPPAVAKEAEHAVVATAATTAPAPQAPVEEEPHAQAFDACGVVIMAAAALAPPAIAEEAEQPHIATYAMVATAEEPHAQAFLVDSFATLLPKGGPSDPHRPHPAPCTGWSGCLAREQRLTGSPLCDAACAHRSGLASSAASVARPRVPGQRHRAGGGAGFVLPKGPASSSVRKTQGTGRQLSLSVCMCMLRRGSAVFVAHVHVARVALCLLPFLLSLLACLCCCLGCPPRAPMCSPPTKT